MTKYVLHAWATAAVLHIHKVVDVRLSMTRRIFFSCFLFEDLCDILMMGGKSFFGKSM